MIPYLAYLIASVSPLISLSGKLNELCSIVGSHSGGIGKCYYFNISQTI